MKEQEEKTSMKSKIIKFIENIIFNIKWVLNLFYFGLIFVLFMYGYTYTKELIAILHSLSTFTMDEMKLLVLDTVDIVMIANLIKMIIAGSYNSFISKNHGYHNENISSGMLKIKISTSILIVASIHLLKLFVNNEINWDIIEKQLFIYAAFLVCPLILGILEFLHVKQEKIESEIERVEVNHTTISNTISNNDLDEIIMGHK